MNEEEEYPATVFDVMGIDPNERAEDNDSAQFWGSLVFGCIMWTVVVSAILAIVGRL